jgi:hypothetical protein
MRSGIFMRSFFTYGFMFSIGGLGFVEFAVPFQRERS